MSLRAVPVVLAFLALTTVAHAQTLRRTTIGGSTESRSRPFAVATPGPAAAAVPGTLTRTGDVPRDGVLFMSERWMIFRDSSGAEMHVPVLRLFEDGRASDWVLESKGTTADGRSLFVIEGWGTFATARPASVERLLRSRESPSVTFARTTLARDPTTAMRHVDALVGSTFADTLYAIAGRPRARTGLLSDAHRRAGDAAVYVVDADSIALDPIGARSVEDLRGLFAHEMGHRLQRQRPEFFAGFWRSVPAIADPHIYGFSNEAEHQAEAFRFAVIYLQTTADAQRDVTADLKLLELYEALMPGTCVTVSALLDETVYRAHRLRSALRQVPAALSAATAGRR